VPRAREAGRINRKGNRQITIIGHGLGAVGERFLERIGRIISGLGHGHSYAKGQGIGKEVLARADTIDKWRLKAVNIRAAPVGSRRTVRDAGGRGRLHRPGALRCGPPKCVARAALVRIWLRCAMIGWCESSPLQLPSWVSHVHSIWAAWRPAQAANSCTSPRVSVAKPPEELAMMSADIVMNNRMGPKVARQF